jgi:hypothetical protein
MNTDWAGFLIVAIYSVITFFLMVLAWAKGYNTGKREGIAQGLRRHPSWRRVEGVARG